MAIPPSDELPREEIEARMTAGLKRALKTGRKDPPAKRPKDDRQSAVR